MNTDEEIREGYRISHEVKTLWKVQMELLAELKRVCQKNGIRFFAAGGTLLGAVRHRGYIPWDDDIDVYMLREDYDKLNRYAHKDFDASKYFYQSTYTDGRIRQHAQLRKNGTTLLLKSDYKKKHHRGIFIDIFPLDKVPDDKEEREAFKKEVKRAYGKCFPPRFSHSKRHHKCVVLLYNAIGVLPRKIIWPISNLFVSRRKKFEKFEKIASRYKDKECKYITNIAMLATLNKDLWLFPAKGYENPVELPFEDTEILAPGDYEVDLRIQYGDYKKIEIGTSLHGQIFFDAERDYSEFDDLTYSAYMELFKQKE